jgi:hypothetical protein
VHRRGALGLAAALIAAAGLAAPLAEAYAPPPADAVFDYQIGGDYPPPAGVEVVSRDWFSGSPAGGGIYSICYVNGFQTQADERGTDRPDEHRNWPRSLVLERLGDDPNWGGEYLVDLRTAVKRRRAARWVGQMIEGCAAQGYDAVEFDNLDSWTRFDGTPLARRVPFGRTDAVAYARLLAERAHALDLAVAQKNTVQLKPAEVGRVGFDFAIAEQCARYRECHRYRRLFGDMVIDIEYRRRDFARACETVGSELSIVLRDVGVSRPGARAYRYDAC